MKKFYVICDGRRFECFDSKIEAIRAKIELETIELNRNGERVFSVMEMEVT